MDRPRAALLGANHWHSPLYLDDLNRFFDLVRVDPDRLAPGDADLALVLARHDDMPALAARAIDARIPLLLEKPGARSLDQLIRVADAARAADVPVAVPLVHRWSPLADALGVLEDPVHFTVSYLVGPPSRYPAAGSGWMLDPEAAGGGALANLGPHFIDLFRMLTGAEVTDVSSQITSSLHDGAVEDHAALLLGTADGRTGVLEVGYTTPEHDAKRHAAFTLTSRAGFVSIGPTGEVRTIGTDGTVVTTEIDIDTDHLYAGFLDRIASRLGDRLRGVPSLDDLVATMRVVRTAYRNANRKELPWAK